MSLKQREAKYLPVVATAFRNAGLPPELGCALARQESAWNPTATASHPGDLARGGAFGLCQMTLKTAREVLGHRDITPEQIFDPAVNAALAAELCVHNLESLAGVTYSDTKAPLMDLAAMYNSGRRYDKAPYITKTNYVPRVLKFMDEYRAALAGTQYAGIRSQRPFPGP